VSEVPDELKGDVKLLNAYISETPELLSLLYDLGLLPEQIEGRPTNRNWRRRHCYMIAEAWKKSHTQP